MDGWMVVEEEWSLNVSIWNLEDVLRSLIKQDILIGQDGRPRPLRSGDRNLEGGVVSEY